MTAPPAIPLFDVGEVVSYTDRHGRLQSGEVRAIEANWRYRPDRPPSLIYDLSHPTYRDRRFYAGEDCIHGLSNQEPSIPTIAQTDAGVRS